jgi:hypothetical protein
MKSLRTSLGWLTLTAVLSCAGLALGQTGGIERVDADTLQRAPSAKEESAPQPGATQTQATSKGQATRAGTADAARHQYHHRWQKRSGADHPSQAASSRRTGPATGASRRAQAGGKSTAQSTGLRDAARRRDRIAATAAGASKRDQARANERLRTRQQRCSEAGEHRQQRRRAGGSNAAAGGGSGSGAARGGR